jgi:aerobic-type carbon monoxide dehydrogenase small subunit (CoxS/CutS family)
VTVLIDGQPVSSCLLLATQGVGKAILTIEGLAKDGQLHPIQQAYIDCTGFQCSFCTPGFILSTKALYVKILAAVKLAQQRLMNKNN